MHLKSYFCGFCSFMSRLEERKALTFAGLKCLASRPHRLFAKRSCKALCFGCELPFRRPKQFRQNPVPLLWMSTRVRDAEGSKREKCSSDDLFLDRLPRTLAAGTGWVASKTISRIHLRFESSLTIDMLADYQDLSNAACDIHRWR